MGIFEDLNTQTFEHFNIQTFQVLSKFLDIFKKIWNSKFSTISIEIFQIAKFFQIPRLETMNQRNGISIQFKFSDILRMIPIIWPTVLQTVILYACVHETR